MSKLRDDLYQRFNGFKPVKTSKGEWYYIDPRYESNDPRSQIKVANENSPNPKINEILEDDINNNPEDYYIWHTKGDDKVRSSHAVRDGKIFNYNVPPEGGNPGEDYNCRCWAEPYHPNKNKQSDVAKVDLSGLPQHMGNDFLNGKHQENYILGTLSQTEEANNNPTAIGYDKDGGYSYGLYQIATKTNSMKGFLNYLANSKDITLLNYYKILSEAGGNEGAKNNSIQFVEAWKKLSTEEKFNESQKNYILSANYKPLIQKINDIKGLNVEQRHPVIQDVLYSMATQHGRADIPVHRALGHNSDISSWSDEQIINALYDARTDYVKNIDMKDKTAQDNIINYRYPRERKNALNLLRK